MSGFLPPTDDQIHFGPQITSAAEALIVFESGLSNPPRPEVLLIARNAEQQMLMMLVVTDTVEPDHVVEVLHSILQVSLNTAVDSVVLASMRPGMPLCVDDALIWWSLQDLANDYGVDVTDWYVLTEEFFHTGDAPSPRIFIEEEAQW